VKPRRTATAQRTSCPPSTASSMPASARRTTTRRNLGVINSPAPGPAR
jgi:hypothetical protein